MDVVTRCSDPECGFVCTVSAKAIGKTIHCSQCGKPFLAVSAERESTNDSLRQTQQKPSGPASTSDHEPGTRAKIPRLGRYIIHERLGGGAFGVVFRATDPQLERDIALKLPRPGTLERAGAIDRFLGEAKAAAKLRHPNIVPIHDAGQEGDQYYIASAFIAGQTLEEFVEKQGRLKPPVAARIVRDLAEAVGYAHSQGIIHRDLKPANVMMDDKVQPHVMDFGLARIADAAVRMTRHGEVMGTPAYMSPEQAAGDNAVVEEATDQYSLGVVLYELLTGEIPFSGPAQVVMVNVRTQPPRPLRSIEPGIPGDLEVICLKAMSKEPRHRYGSCREFAQDLDRWLRGEPIIARRISAGERLVRWCRRNPMVATLVGATATLLVAVAVISTVAAIRLNDLATREHNETLRANRETNKAQIEQARAMELAIANESLAKQETQAREKSDRNAETALRLAKRARRNLFLSNMNVVQSNWEDSRIRAVHELLERWQPGETPALPKGTDTPADEMILNDDLRGFEWYYWNHLAHSSLLELTGGITACSADGRLLASAGKGVVIIREMSDGRETRRVPWNSSVSSLAISPDGRLIAATDGDGALKVWDLSRDQEVLSAPGHVQQGISRVGYQPRVAFSPDGRRLAAIRFGGLVKVWDPAASRELLTLNALEGHSLYALAFSPDGRQLASAGRDIQTWDVESGRSLVKFTGHPESISELAFNEDGTSIGSAGFDGTVKIWKTVDGTERSSWKGQLNKAVCAAFAPDLKRVAISSYADRIVKVWETSKGQELFVLRGHSEGVRQMQFSPDGTRLISTDGNDVKVLDAINGQEPVSTRSKRLNIGGTFPNWIAFSPDGSTLATTSQELCGRLWDSTSGMSLKSAMKHAHRLNCVTFSPDGRLLASSTLAGPQETVVRLWNAADVTELRDMQGLTGQVSSVAFSPDGTRLATAGQELKIWNVADGTEFKALKGPPCLRVAFSPDRQRVAAAGMDQTIRIWDASTGQELQVLRGHSGIILGLAFDTRGERLASACQDQTVKLWDPRTGRELLTLKGHTQVVNCVTFSPDGERVLSASDDKTIKVWDAQTGQETLTLKGHAESISSIACCSDGMRIASIDTEYVIKIWDARPWTGDLKSEQQALSLAWHLCHSESSKETVLGKIRSNSSMTEAVRRKSIALAESVADSMEQQARDYLQLTLIYAKNRKQVLGAIEHNPFLSDGVRIRAMALAPSLIEHLEP
jgi:WD40 repeat protein